MPEGGADDVRPLVAISCVHVPDMLTSKHAQRYVHQYPKVHVMVQHKVSITNVRMTPHGRYRSLCHCSLAGFMGLINLVNFVLTREKVTISIDTMKDKGKQRNDVKVTVL